MALKVFIVEDSATIRDNLIETLGDLTGAVTVGHAGTEMEAVTWLNHPDQPWDLAIVDLFLREGNGLSVLHAINQRLPSQKAVVLSNYATPDIRTRCLSLGADAVFDKSQDIEELIQYCISLQTQDSGSAALA